jgi:molybdenum cofactor cytidylyltransferase
MISLDGMTRGFAVGAVLLAAGSASRMGLRPKCLLELDGEPLIRRQLLALANAGVCDVVVVLGHYADRVEAAIKDLPSHRVRNPDPDAGQISSLRVGLKAQQDDKLRQVDAVLVMLADQPLIGSHDIQDLISAYAHRPESTQVVQPTVDGLPGNPVMFSASVRDEILNSDSTIGCRQWQSAHPSRVYHWPTTNPRYRLDVDTVEDIENLALKTGHRLQWPST